MIQQPDSAIHGIAVYQEGTILFENYYNGHGPKDRFHVASVTKSILSALIGIAIDRDFIHSTDQKVADFFPDYGLPSDNRCIQNVTLQHLLTMTVPYAHPDWQEPFAELCSSPDWTSYILGQLGKGGTAEAFKYSSCSAHLLSVILTRATGECARDFANEYLMPPAGMTAIPVYPMEGYGIEELFGHKVRGWTSDPNGNSTGGWGLTLTLSDMIKFGTLCLNGGTLSGRQIIPAGWIEKATAPNPYNYGYLWWLDLFNKETKHDTRTFTAIGDGGNMIHCIPEKQMVIAVVSEIKI